MKRIAVVLVAFILNACAAGPTPQQWRDVGLAPAPNGMKWVDCVRDHQGRLNGCRLVEDSWLSGLTRIDIRATAR